MMRKGLRNAPRNVEGHGRSGASVGVRKPCGGIAFLGERANSSRRALAFATQFPMTRPIRSSGDVGNGGRSWR